MGWLARSLILTLALLLLGAGIGLLRLGDRDVREQLGHELFGRVPEPIARALVERGPELAGRLAPALLIGGPLVGVLALWPRRKKRKGAAGAVAVPAVKKTDPKAPSRKDARRALKTAKEVEAARGPEAAGELLLKSGLRDEACKRFMAASNLVRAAEVRHDQNRFDEAADLYAQADRHDSAGAIWVQLGRFQDAARCYERAGKGSVAGELYERAESFADAGRCYRETGFQRHAAQAFLKGGADLEAAEALAAAFEEESLGAGGENAGKQKELRGVARKAAELFVKHERLDEGENLLVRAGLLGAGAQIAMRSGAFERAADLFLRAGRGDLAAEAFERAGDAVAAARYRGEHLRSEGHDEEAVRCLEEAGEFGDAGDLYRKLGRFERAGECYLRAKDPAAAAEMLRAAELPERAAAAYESANRLDDAVDCYRQAGDLGRVAELLEQAGNLFAAGKAYAELERIDDAIRLLQQIEESFPEYAEACSILGRLFETKGMHSLSIRKLEQAAGNSAVTRATVDAHYDLACASERRGDNDKAIEVYERILVFDYHYRDVAARLEQVKQRQRSGPVLSAQSGGSTRYEIKRELGRGGMGVVYLARDSVLERDVAFKVLPESLRGNQNALRSFLREAKAAAQLNHPHIVTVYDAGESQHGFYLAMEYVDGTTLKQILQRRGPLSTAGVLHVLRQMLEALEYAHSRKVVHRDIKTANTMWTRSKQVKIMDFGLAKVIEEVRNATTLVSGTPFYMSPEQTLGRNVDHRTDLYSLGVTLFELSTGELPFRKGNVPYHHVHTAPPDPRDVRGDVPESLAALILRCLEKSPEARYQSAGDMRVAVAALASAGESTSPGSSAR